MIVGNTTLPARLAEAELEQIDQIILPRTGTSSRHGEMQGQLCGVDFGAPSKVLLWRESDNKVLLWCGGSTYQSWRRTVYGESSLELGAMVWGWQWSHGEKKEMWGRNYKKTALSGSGTLHEGGRLSAALIEQHRPRLEQEFGVTLLKGQISIKHTLKIRS